MSKTTLGVVLSGVVPAEHRDDVQIG